MSISPKKDFFDYQRKYGPLLSLGFQLAAGLIGFVLLGHFIDQKLEGGGEQDFPVFTVLGTVLGFLYGAYEIWKLIKSLNDNNK